jgi:uncharacterized protein YhbP (UPF0306 family)
MMRNNDDQAAESGARGDNHESEEELRERIRRLVTDQPYGVLCTQGDGQPYGSMIAFAFAEDLTSFVFATPSATRKYKLLCECSHVALVVDNRSLHPDEMMKIEAMTVTGRACEIKKGPEFEKWAKLYVQRHPHLETFIRSKSSAMFRTDVTRYLHVSRFQEVRQWIPAAP